MTTPNSVLDYRHQWRLPVARSRLWDQIGWLHAPPYRYAMGPRPCGRAHRGLLRRHRAQRQRDEHRDANSASTVLTPTA